MSGYAGFAAEAAPTETSQPIQNVRDVGGASAPMAAGPLCLFAAEAAPTDPLLQPHFYKAATVNPFRFLIGYTSGYTSGLSVLQTLSRITIMPHSSLA